MPRGASKLDSLRKIVRSSESAGIAFSGGLDSSVVARVAREELGDSTAAFTVDSPLMARKDLAHSRRMAKAIGLRHMVLKSSMLSDPSFVDNPPDRCYMCKRAVMGDIIAAARELGLKSVMDGSNADDRTDRRPGSRACKEKGVRSPLAEAGFTKADVVAAARRLGLPSPDRPPSPCLATRIPYGSEITTEKLKTVERAEEYLRSKGFTQVRVRHHGDTARIEVPPQDIGKLTGNRTRQLVDRRFKSLGFSYVTVDLRGYRSGSMDEVL